MRAFAAFAAVAIAVGCSREQPAPTSAPMRNVTLTQTPFGRTPDGEGIGLMTLKNANGIEVRVMTYGGIIVSIKTPDRTGEFGDIVLGHDTAEEYFKNPNYFGVLVGRYANRIAKAAFVLDGKTYKLAANNGVNSLHGGAKGWDQAVWKADPFQDARGVGVVLTHTSPNGDEGYPGTVTAKVTYTLTDRNELAVDYEATTDAPTVINLTQHSYFNLSAGQTQTILEHRLMINADRYTPVDDTLIPTGELALVQDTPFDFRTTTAMGARIDQKNNTQLERGKGYDHNWVLNAASEGLTKAASVFDPRSGRTLDISTTEPGIQFYSGNFLDGTVKGKGGVMIPHRGGFCLETQHFPDSPNHPSFPSTVLRPGQQYRSRTVFTFGVEK